MPTLTVPVLKYLKDMDENWRRGMFAGQEKAEQIAGDALWEVLKHSPQFEQFVHDKIRDALTKGDDL